jgi:polysaccharide deacetylase
VDRRKLLAGAGLVTAGGAAGVGTGIAAWQEAAAEGPAARTATPAGSGAYATEVTFRAAPSVRIIALTIDDGPTQQWTPRLLSILRRHGAKATFFRVGRLAPGLELCLAAGFELGRGGAGPDGSSGVAYQVLLFLQRTQGGDGTWAARYWPDGSGPVRRPSLRTRRGRLGPGGRLVLGAGPAARTRQSGPPRSHPALAHGRPDRRRRRPLADR